MLLISDCWKQIIRVRHELAAFSNSPVPAPQMGPPASPNELRALERHLGLTLPPSYREFLSLYNGVENFVGDVALRSTHTILAGEEDWLEEIAEEFPEFVKFCFAGDQHSYGDCYFFDPRHVAPDGEMEVVAVSLKMDEARWPNFSVLLQDMLERLELALAAERSDREALSD